MPQMGDAAFPGGLSRKVVLLPLAGGGGLSHERGTDLVPPNPYLGGVGLLWGAP